MGIWTLHELSILGIVLGVIIGNAEANAASREPFMAIAGETSQPIGHFEFCRKHVSECRVKSRNDARVGLSPDRWSQLVAVNAAVNVSVEPATDDEIFGRQEVWSYPGRRGDCEDLALLKRRRLIEDGWPVGALLMTVVRQTNGEGHAILTVLTDRGDLVLDNLAPRVMVWSETDYHYVKRQSQFNSGRWTAIDDARTTSVGSLAR